MNTIAQRGVFLHVTFGSPHDDGGHSDCPAHTNGTVGDCSRDALYHRGIVKEVHGLAGRAPGAVRLPDNVEPLADFRCWKLLPEIILRDDR
jgi:hypothetical protein